MLKCVKELKNGARYLVISETEQGKAEHHRVMIFEESMEAFMSALHNTVNHVSRQPVKPEKVYSFKDVRKKIPNAYAKWPTNDNEHLKKKYGEGIKMSKLAKLLNRKEGSILSRLTKLGLLIPKHGG